MKYYKTKNSVSVQLRLPEEADAQEMISFYNQVGNETTFLGFVGSEYGLSEEQQAQAIKDANASENNTILLATVNSKIVGIGTISSNNKRIKSRHVGSLGIVISKVFCNIGLGAIMMTYLIDWCKNNHITTKISLSVRKDNSRAIALYEKFGFQTEGILKNEVLIGTDYFDLVAMALIIS